MNELDRKLYRKSIAMTFLVPLEQSAEKYPNLIKFCKDITEKGDHKGDFDQIFIELDKWKHDIEHRGFYKYSDSLCNHT